MADRLKEQVLEIVHKLDLRPRKYLD